RSRSVGRIRRSRTSTRSLGSATDRIRLGSTGGDEARRTVMFRRYPVVQHRWFKGGEGWAYDASVDANYVRLADSLDPALRRPATRGERTRVGLPSCGGWLVGERADDPDPVDPRAVRGGARPFVLCVAFLDQQDEPAADLQEEVRRLLRELPIPQRDVQQL